MPARFLRDLSTTALQLLLNQALAFLLFLLLSRHLSREAFGDLSWCLALLLIVFTLAGAGIEPIVIRRVAAEEPAPPILTAYLRHLITTGLLSLSLLLVFSLGFLAPPISLLLLVLASGKWALSLAQPLKAWASGKERFGLLLLLSLPAAILKLLAVGLLLATGDLSLTPLAFCFALADLAEAALGLLLLGRKTGGVFLRLRVPQRNLLLAPQFGVVIFGTLLSRFDQVLLGWMRPSADLADYAFCVRIFELSTLPLLALGPLLLPRLSRGAGDSKTLRRLLGGEMALALGTLVLLNILWTPLTEAWTGGRYGQRNEAVIFWLSLSLPLLYLNNFLWTWLFTKGQLTVILRVVALTFCVNFILNLLLIPALGPAGAAIAFFAAQLLQGSVYFLRARPLRLFTSPKPHDHPVHL